MSQVLRKIAMFKANRSTSYRAKEHESRTNVLLNKERDKLLQEFLLAREELKTQFDCEKREIVGNYERRIHYLTRMLEQCDENTNILKLNLDAEKEQNFIMKTKMMELQREEYSASGKAHAGSLNKCFDKESFSSSPYITSEVESSKSIEKSSVAGLKYSDRIASCGSMQTSPATSSSYSDNYFKCVKNSDYDNDSHRNCREEFSRLLEELRVQQAKFDVQLKEEKQSMFEQLENEKLQMERVVYKQLNIRLECEVKKQEMLLIENAHLRRTISNVIVKRINSKEVEENNKFQRKWNDAWKETNSDSGADIDADNRSDEDGSDMSDSGKGSLTLSDRALNHSWLRQQDNVLLNGISKLMQQPLYTVDSASRKNNFTDGKPNMISATGTTEESFLSTEVNSSDFDKSNSSYDEMAHFNEELKIKLKALENLLVVGEEAVQ